MGADRIAWGLFFGHGMAGRWGDLVTFGATPADAAAGSGGRVIYLATPYSREVVAEDGRWEYSRSVEASVRAARVAARITRAGATCVSPIIQSAEMCHSASDLDPLDAEFWGRWCQPLLSASGSVYVPDLPGWQRSAGIWAEVVWALGAMKPVRFGAGVAA